MPKPYLTIEQQIELLRSRGLTIQDDADVRKFLLENNYYRISGYSLTLRKNDRFYKGASFQNIQEIYLFDEGLRNALLFAIGKVEITVKSLYAYHFSAKYGGLGYLDETNFTDRNKYQQIMDKVEGTKAKNLDTEAFIQHYVNDLQEDMPLWVYIELFTISDISKLYSITDDEIQRKIADHFGIAHSTAPSTMCKLLKCMSILRNICAHHGRIYNRLFKTKPSLNRAQLALLQRDSSNRPDNSKAFGYILILKRLLSDADYNDLKTKIIELTKRYPFVDMRYYGFCKDWKAKI